MKRVPFIFLFAIASVLACGPFVNDLLPIETVRPADLDAYATRGEIGIVRPQFARRYLVQAYRRMAGREPLRAVARMPLHFDPDAQGSMEKWSAAYQRVTGAAPRITTDRNIGDYQYIRNCLGPAFATATQTLVQRESKYGTGSREVRDWLTAQDQVFQNCGGDPLVVPPALPASADPLARADRDYQIAAAHFYAMEYDEAVQRFRRIALDQASPWRTYGHYMAGRAWLRQATTEKELDRDALTRAAAEFRLLLADANASGLHASTRGLLDRLALRANPAGRLRELSAMLTGPAEAGDQALRDYEYLMDAVVGDVTTYEYDKIPDRAAISATADLNEWVLVMQGTGQSATDRAMTQWKQTGSVAWTAAALWKIPSASTDAPALLQAASRVDRSSPAYFTVAFLRARLLALRNQHEDARAILASLPVRAAAGGPDAETVNLFNALRFKLARGMDELIAAAPRRVVSNRWPGWNVADAGDPLPPEPVFDDDAGVVFSERLPLARLIEAAKSSALHDRLRMRIAAAAFARAWMLKRYDEARDVAPVLRQLSPSLAADMTKFEAAPTEQDRHLAGLRLVLRTPGLRATVKGVEDDADYTSKQLARDFDHTFRRNWWCGFSEGDTDKPARDSQILQLLYPDGEVGYPVFLSKDEIAATQKEWAALSALGPAPTYLAREAVKWATSRPTDLDAAEALAHAVEGTRWGCGDSTTTPASRSAFQALHKLFPKTEWARRTRYWY